MNTYDEIKKKYSLDEKRICLDPTRGIHTSVRVVSNENKNQTPILIVPGGPGCDASFYIDHIEILIDFAPIILFDPRGTGESDKHHMELCTLEQHIEDIETIRKALRVPKFHLLATSYGGMVGIGYALHYQEFIEKLILGVTAHTGDFIAKAKENLIEEGTKEEQHYGNHILEGTVRNGEHMATIFEKLKCLYSYQNRKNPKKAEKSPKIDGNKFSFESLNLGFGGFLRKMDFSTQLSRITVPTLVFAGKYDWICDVSFSYEMNRKIPNSELLVLPGGHNLLFDCPQQYKHHITHFLNISL